MLLFRSEGHVEKWCRDWNLPRGEVFTARRCWRLAQAWHGPDRRDPAWRRRTADEAQAIFARLGFTSPFWRLPR